MFDALPIYDDHYDIIGAFGQFRDVTQLYEAEEKYNHLAYHDDLTGLPNRRLFYKQLNEMSDFVEQNNNNFAILYIDLDRFKMVNDMLGHLNGAIMTTRSKRGHVEFKQPPVKLVADMPE